MGNINNIHIGSGNPQAIMFKDCLTTTKKAPIQFYKLVNDGGGYFVRGIWLAPLINGSYVYSWPWDLGVTSGALKDINYGAKYWGYVKDGYNKNLTSGLTNFPNNGATIKGVGICIYFNEPNYVDTSNYQCLDFGNNPIVITFKDDRFIRYIPNSARMPGSVYEWSQDRKTIKIYRVGPSRMVCRLLWEDNTDVNKCRNMLSNVYADVSGIEQYTTDKIYKIFDTKECWEAYRNGELIYKKDKTVENCLAKYYGSIDGNGKITINTPSDGSTPILPKLNTIVDINDYDTKQLKFSVKGGENDDALVDWMNNNFASLMGKGKMIQTLISEGYYGKIKVNNTKDNPIVIYCPLGANSMDEYTRSSDYLWEVLDNMLFDNILGESDINYLKIIFKDKGLALKTSISVAHRAFRALNYIDLEIEHQEADGTIIKPVQAKWGFRPMQLNGTFERSNVKVIKRDWIDWSRVTNMPYAFDYCSSLKEIQGNGEEMVFYPHNMSSPEGDENGDYKWPYFSHIQGNVNAETYDIVQAFNGCTNLERIEPILNVKYIANPDNIYNACNNPNVTYMKIKGLNNFNWDFAGTNFNLPNLDAECVQFLLENVEDQVGISYDQSLVDMTNVNSTYPNVYFDHHHIRSSRYEGEGFLALNCPIEWTGFLLSNYQGWEIKSSSDVSKLNNTMFALKTRTAQSGVALQNITNSKTISNFTFKVEGLQNGDILVIGGPGGKDGSATIYNTDGTYTVYRLDGKWGFALYNDDTSVNTPVVVTLISANEYPNKLTRNLVTLARNKGWDVQVNHESIDV